MQKVKLPSIPSADNTTAALQPESRNLLSDDTTAVSRQDHRPVDDTTAVQKPDYAAEDNTTIVPSEQPSNVSAAYAANYKPRTLPARSMEAMLDLDVVDVAAKATRKFQTDVSSPDTVLLKDPYAAGKNRSECVGCPNTLRASAKPFSLQSKHPAPSSKPGKLIQQHKKQAVTIQAVPPAVVTQCTKAVPIQMITDAVAVAVAVQLSLRYMQAGLMQMVPVLTAMQPMSQPMQEPSI